MKNLHIIESYHPSLRNAKKVVRQTSGRLKELGNSLLLYRFNNLLTFDKVLHINCDNKPLDDRYKLDLVTVAFNNDKVIAQQIRLLNKYLLDPYHYTIADNSPDPLKREKIMELCKESDVPYIQLPKNPFSSKDPSLSHGAALTWIFKNFIKSRRADFFGFIDHDIFPIQPTKIMDSLQESPVYGLIQERDEIWYLWAGFCFFQYDYIRNCKINFMPAIGYDTGGGNWESIYSKLDKGTVPDLKHVYGILRDGNDPQSDWVEYIGDWLHTFNASNWKKVRDKDHLVDELLNKY